MNQFLPDGERPPGKPSALSPRPEAIFNAELEDVICELEKGWMK